MRIMERISGLTSKIISKLSIKQFVDINELPLFKTPNYMFRLKYWLGALVAAAFIWEVITGLFLLLNYYPSNPYAQTEYLISKIPFGAPILYSHLYGAYFMIALAYVHLFRNYFDGAYKRPRQLLWVVGIALFAITLGTAFTGYSLPADILGADADGVAQGIVAGAPGGALINTILFGNGLSVDMYTRLLGWHIILTALLGALVGVHFLLFEQYGIMPSKKVMDKAPAVYPKEEWENFNPWFPRNFLYTLQLTLMVWALILIIPNVVINIPNIPTSISPLFSPAPLVSPSGVLPPGTPAFPPWFFLFLYKALDFLQPGGAPYLPFIASILAGLLPVLYLVLLPLLDRSEHVSHEKRMLFSGVGILFITYLMQLSVWGVVAAGVTESFSTQVGVMLPPILITFGSLYLIPRALDSKKGERTLTLKNAGLLIAVFLVIVGTIHTAMNNQLIYLIGIIVPLVFSVALCSHRHARMLLAWFVTAILTYAVQVVAWFGTGSGSGQPYPSEMGILIPPAIFAAAALYIVPSIVRRSNSGINVSRLGLVVAGAVVLFVLGLTSGSLALYPPTYLLGIAIPFILAFLLYRRGFPDEAGTEAKEETHPGLMSYNLAMFFLILLFVIAAGILVLMIRLPVTGTASTYWGVGSGIILLIFSYALSLYGYLYFPQENDEFRVKNPPKRGVNVLVHSVSGSSDEIESDKAVESTSQSGNITFED